MLATTRTPVSAGMSAAAFSRNVNNSRGVSKNRHARTSGMPEIAGRPATVRRLQTKVTPLTAGMPATAGTQVIAMMNQH
jgi:hypothetical protein